MGSFDERADLFEMKVDIVVYACYNGNCNKCNKFVINIDIVERSCKNIETVAKKYVWRVA